VEAYSLDEFERYCVYAEVLTNVLKRACARAAPLAIVQARPKSVSSFAEKAVRKAFKYPDPVHQITDLCGARVITYTQVEVSRLCDFIRAHFRIDEANSLDVRTRLKETEFGYLSVHYVVQLDRDELLGVPIPREVIGDRKAEIQVRTLLQHAWASIMHDRMYKSTFTVPQRFVRGSALLAANLENADAAFARFTADIDTYKGDYAAYMSPQEMQAEIEVLQLILKNEPVDENKPGIALRIAEISRSGGDDRKVIETLEPYAAQEGDVPSKVLLELGRALVREHRDDPESEQFRRGQEFLSRIGRSGDRALAVEADQDAVTRSAALAALAASYADMPGQEHQARGLYREALSLDPANPYHLAALLEHEVLCSRDREFAAAMQPVLRDGLAACRAHVDAGIELPRAYFTMGRLNLLLGEAYRSLAHYAKAVHCYRARDACLPEDTFEAELRFLQRINVGRALPPEDRWVERLLVLASAGAADDPAAPRPLQDGALRRTAFEEPVVVLAGAAEKAPDDLQVYGDMLTGALSDFSGTVVSGGTTVGVPGLVGQICAHCADEGTKAFTAVGYLAEHLPSECSKDTRYDELFETKGELLGPAQVLQYWTDLLAAGVRPESVRVVGISGGAVAGFEYRLALALGAKVAVIQSSGRAAAELLGDADWSDAVNLVGLPTDMATLVAYLGTPVSCLSTERLDDAAKLVHAKYVEDSKHLVTDPAMLPWDDLPETLKESNRQQVAHGERTLRAAGYSVREATGSASIPQFSPEEVEVMAEIEHGRWNAERLLAGWRYGSTRDVETKTSPYLVSWSELPDAIREYDRKAVRDLPHVFAEVGLEVYRAPIEGG